MDAQLRHGDSEWLCGSFAVTVMSRLLSIPSSLEHIPDIGAPGQGIKDSCQSLRLQ
jgi:hypothetical protein